MGDASDSQALRSTRLQGRRRPRGVNTLMAYNPATGQIFLGFTNIFGYFNEAVFWGMS